MVTVSDDKRRKEHTIGLVPTMGALHGGHLSLVRRALEISDYVIVSIYVNPLQFGPSEDFYTYPRDIDADIQVLESVGAHAVFTPDDLMMYPEGYSTYVTVEGMTECLCGRSRPTHFRGVTTIVTKLFNIIRPHVAIFGQKDAQQLFIIRRMVEDLNMTINIDAYPIVREPDGLAMSSRNRYLNGEERKQATVLYRGIEKAHELVINGITKSDTILAAVREVLGTASLAETEYVELVDTQFLKPTNDVSTGALLALAVRFGRIRLIDNVIF
jgi:pantoate--beta-alanine ligase